MAAVRGRRIRDRSQDVESLFVYNLDYYDFDAPLAVTGSHSRVARQIAASAPRSTSKNAKTNSSIVNGNAIPRKLDTNPDIPEDPLDPMRPSYYLGHHRRMEREEKRMQQADREKLASEAIALQSQRERLVGIDWKTNIQSIVKIDTPGDVAELEKKRKLALDEIDLFMRRFKRLKQLDRDRRSTMHDEHLVAEQVPLDGSSGQKKRKSLGKKTKSTSKRQRTSNGTSILGGPRVSSNLGGPLRAGRKDILRSRHRSEHDSTSATASTSDTDSGSSSNSEEHKESLLKIRIAPTAFGYCVPPRKTRPTEFDIPQSWKAWAQTFTQVTGAVKRRLSFVVGPGTGVGAGSGAASGAGTRGNP